MLDPVHVPPAPTSRQEATAAHLRYVPAQPRQETALVNALDLAYPTRHPSADVASPHVSAPREATYTPDEIRAIREYSDDMSGNTSLNAEYVNNALRAAQGRGKRVGDTNRFTEEHIEQRINTLDQMLEKNKQGKIQKTQRGIKYNFAKDPSAHRLSPQLRANGVFRDPAFLSTSKVSPETLSARKSFVTRGAQVTLFGTSGIDIAPALDGYGGHVGAHNEGEVLYPRDTPMRVLFDFDKDEHDKFDTPRLKERLAAQGLDLPDTLSERNISKLERKGLSFSWWRSVAEEQGLRNTAYTEQRKTTPFADISAALPARTAREARRFAQEHRFTENSVLGDRWLSADSPFATVPAQVHQTRTYVAKNSLVAYEPLKARQIGQAEMRKTHPGGFYETETGEIGYAKFHENPEQSQFSHLGNSLYRAFGFPAPQSRLVSINGQKALFSPKIDGQHIDESSIIAHQDLRKGFALDAILANHDVIGDGYGQRLGTNILVDQHGRAVRIDNDSTLDFRGTNAKKFVSTSTVEELDSMRDLRFASSRVFGGLSDSEVAEQIQSLLETRKSLSLDDIVKASGFSGERATEITAKLESRFAAAKAWAENHREAVPPKAESRTVVTGSTQEKVVADSNVKHSQQAVIPPTQPKAHSAESASAAPQQYEQPTSNTSSNTGRKVGIATLALLGTGGAGYALYAYLQNQLRLVRLSRSH